MAQKWFETTGAPTSTPSAVGDINIDTTNDKAYIAVGTSTVNDWQLIASTSAPLGLYRTIWIGAGAMVARTTSGAASGTSESTTNKIMNDYFDFT